MKHIYIILLFVAVALLNSRAQTWSAVGDSTQRLMYDSVTPSGTVYVLRHIDSLLYVGGAFKYTGIIRVNGTAIWNGAFWQPIGNGMGPYGSAKCFEKFQNTIYAGGSSAFLSFDGADWNLVGSGLTTSNVYALSFINKLFLGGSDIRLNNVQMNSIAGWDGSDYSGLAGGVTGWMPKVKVMCVFNDELIVGGEFSKAGNITAFNVASWDGLEWEALDTGVSAVVEALTVDSINNFLYVGGGFSSAGGDDGINAYGITMWDGYIWHEVGGGLNYCDVLALSLYNNELYAGKCLSGYTNYNHALAKWNGINWNFWDTLTGPNNVVFALCVYNNDLYVGGGFKKVGNDTMIGIARYHAPPDTTSCLFIQPLIHAMPFGTKEAADTIYTTAPYHIQFYTNNKYASNWSWDFGDGGTANTREPDHTYAAPGTYNVTLEVIHPHNLSSQVCTLSVSKTITIIDNTAVEESGKDTIEYLGQNIPNPFSNSTSIPYYVPYGSIGLLQIHNTNGELINEYELQQGHNSLEISMASYKAGVYFYSIVIDGWVKGSKRMVVE
ncbi:MAG: PKD domain-containing protein [Bacteroidales bacterium]|nr:PKD domain-containing protein [Bacteroidales bacterium]